MMNEWTVFTPAGVESAYDVQGFYQEAFIASFQRLGCVARPLQLQRRSSTSSHAFVFFLGMLRPMDLDRLDRCYPDVPIVTYLMDHPALCVPLDNPITKRMIPVTFDLSWIDFLNRHYADRVGEPMLLPPPAARFDAAELKPIKERGIDVSFFGTLRDPEVALAEWERRSPGIAEQARRIIRQLDANLAEPVDVFLERLIQDPLGANIGPFKCMLACVDQYTRQKRRLDALRAVAKSNARVQLRVNDPDVHAKWFPAGNVVVGPPVNFDESLDILADSKIALVNRPNLVGVNERLVAAMSRGCVSVTDANVWLRSQFRNGEGMCFYDYGALDLLPAMIDEILDDDDLASRLGERAIAAAQSRFDADVLTRRLMERVVGDGF